MKLYATITPLSLPGGSVLRIDHGRGILVRTATGRVWLTEQGRGDDIVLGHGQAARIRRWGRAVLSAWKPARIVLEVPRAVTASLEIAPAEGEPGRVLSGATWPHIDEMLRTFGRWVRSLAGGSRAFQSPAAGRHEIQRQVRRAARGEPPGAPPAIDPVMWKV